MDISLLENLSSTKEDDQFMTLSVGPQHPGSGHFRFTIKADGYYIVYCDPDLGYVHREEKMCEFLKSYVTNKYILDKLEKIKDKKYKNVAESTHETDLVY